MNTSPIPSRPQSGKLNHAIAETSLATLPRTNAQFIAMICTPTDSTRFCRMSRYRGRRPWTPATVQHCIFDLRGVTTGYRTTYGCVVTSWPEERQSWLDDVAGTVARHSQAQAGGWRATTR